MSGSLFSLRALPCHPNCQHRCYKFVGYMEEVLNSGAHLAKRMAKMDGLVWVSS